MGRIFFIVWLFFAALFSAKGTTTCSYDSVGNLTNINYPLSPDILAKYDSLDRLTNLVTVGQFTNNYTYSAFGGMESEDGPWGSDTVTYGYTDRMLTSLNVQQPSASALRLLGVTIDDVFCSRSRFTAEAACGSVPHRELVFTAPFFHCYRRNVA